MHTASLHEFMLENRDELLAICARKTKLALGGDDELGPDFVTVVDEIIRALQHEAGLPARSPLPGRSENATRHGAERQHRGFAIAKLSLDFGSISDAVGELGGTKGLSFAAGEYQVFNQCIDTAIAAAIEQY